MVFPQEFLSPCLHVPTRISGSIPEFPTFVGDEFSLHHLVVTTDLPGLRYWSTERQAKPLCCLPMSVFRPPQTPSPSFHCVGPLNSLNVFTPSLESPCAGSVPSPIITPPPPPRLLTTNHQLTPQNSALSTRICRCYSRRKKTTEKTMPRPTPDTATREKRVDRRAVHTAEQFSKVQKSS